MPCSRCSYDPRVHLRRHHRLLFDLHRCLFEGMQDVLDPFIQEKHEPLSVLIETLASKHGTGWKMTSAPAATLILCQKSELASLKRRGKAVHDASSFFGQSQPDDLDSKQVWLAQLNWKLCRRWYPGRLPMESHAWGTLLQKQLLRGRVS